MTATHDTTVTAEAVNNMNNHDVINAARLFLGFVGDMDNPTPLHESAWQMAFVCEGDEARVLGMLTLLTLAKRDRRWVSRQAQRALDDAYDRLLAYAKDLGVTPPIAFTFKPNYELERAHTEGTYAYDFLQTCLDEEKANQPTAALMKASWAVGERAEIDYDDPGASQHRLAMVMTIDAALGDPDAVMRALRVVRDRLIANDPTLALLR